MLSLDDIVKKLNKMSYIELQEMANKTDVSFDTLRSIRIGRSKNPRLSTMIAISDYLNEL